MDLKEKADKDSGSNKEVFAELYEINLPRVFRYIYYRLGDISVAEDLTSSVFEKALAKFNRYRSDKASFATWLFSIARNTIIDYYRKTSRQPTIVLSQEYESASGMEELIKKEELQRLFLYLSQLSQLEQEIISLKFGSGLTNREITRLLNLSESNVGTILYRAICKLKAKFEEDENE